MTAKMQYITFSVFGFRYAANIAATCKSPLSVLHCPYFMPVMPRCYQCKVKKKKDKNEIIY